MESILKHGGNRAWAAQQAGCLPEQILDFSASISPLGMPDSVLRLLQSPAAIAALGSYPDRQYTNLRQAIANYHQISPAWVMPGNGAAELLTWAGRELATKSITFISQPAFGDYLRALTAFDANIRHLPLQKMENGEIRAGFPVFNPQLAAFYQECGILLNNPHNPTGGLLRRSQLDLVLNNFGLVVVDEAFMDFLPPADCQSLIELVKDYSNLVVLRSLTKFYALPGLRIGYAIAHPDRLQTWQAWRDPWSVNVLAEQAAIACVGDQEFQQTTWAWLPEARSHLHQGLQQIPGLKPQMGAANFLLVECQSSAIKLRNALLSRDRILIRDCQSFSELGDHYFRLCVGTIATQERLLKAIQACLTPSSPQ